MSETITTDTGMCIRTDDESVRTGEWSVRDFDYHEYGDITLNETHDGITVAFAYLQGRGPEIKQRAEQIVSDRNVIPKLVAALEIAMKVVSDRAAGGRMLTMADEASAILDKCNAALALVKGRE